MPQRPRLDGGLRRPLKERAEDQKTGEQGVNDPDVSSRWSPDLRIVGSFTPCAAVSAIGARAVANVRTIRASEWPTTDNLQASPAAITRGIFTLDRGIVQGSPLRSDLAYPRGSRLVRAPTAPAREALTTPRPSVGPGRCVMAAIRPPNNPFPRGPGRECRLIARFGVG
jgi:hypothetical protein